MQQQSRLTVHLRATLVAVATVAAATVVAAPALAAPGHGGPAHNSRRGPTLHAHIPSLDRLAAARVAHARAVASPRATGPAAGDPYAVTASTSSTGLAYTDLETRATGTFSQAGTSAGSPDQAAQVPTTSLDGTGVAYSYANQAGQTTINNGIGVFTIGSSTARTALTSQTFDASTGTGTIDFDPAFSRDGSSIFFDRQVTTTDPSNPSVLDATIDIYSMPRTGGTPTLVASDASNPSFDVSGNLVYLDQSALPVSGSINGSCLVLRRAPSATAGTCVLTYGQASSSLSGTPAADSIFAIDLRASRYSSQITFAVGYTNASGDHTVLALVTPGASAPLRPLGGTEAGGTVVEGQADLDATGTEVTFDRVPLDDQGNPTSGTLYAVDVATGFHLAIVAGAADLGATTFIPPAQAPAGSVYVPLSTPYRILDTRSGTGGHKGPVSAGAPIDVKITTSSGPVPPGASAVVLNVAGISPSQNTYVQVYPTPTTGAGVPLVSTLNLSAHQIAANADTAKLPASGWLRFATANGSIHLAADVVGYYTSSNVTGASLFTSLATPSRVLDTREGVGAPKAAVAGGSAVDVTVASPAGVVPTSATAVVLTVGGLAGSAATYVTALPTPAGEPAATTPSTSTINLAPKEIRENLATVSIGAGGKVRFYNAAGASNIIADVVGYYLPASEGGKRYVPVDPLRIFDTRNGTNFVYGLAFKTGAGQRADAVTAGVLTVSTGLVRIPVGASAVQVNLTAANGTRPTFLSLFAPPGPSSTPTFSSIFATNNQPIASSAITGVGTGNLSRIYNDAGAIDSILDVSGYFI